MNKKRITEIADNAAGQLYDAYGVVEDEDNPRRYRLDMAPECQDVEKAIESAVKLALKEDNERLKRSFQLWNELFKIDARKWDSKNWRQYQVKWASIKLRARKLMKEE